jgi:hypothetical protein
MVILLKIIIMEKYILIISDEYSTIAVSTHFKTLEELKEAAFAKIDEGYYAHAYELGNPLFVHEFGKRIQEIFEE